MKVFWFRILLWFFLTFLGVSLCFFGPAYFIQSRTLSSAPASERTEEHQDTGNRGAIEANRKIVFSANLLAFYGATMAAAFAVIGWLVVRKTFTPIVSLNETLDLGLGRRIVTALVALQQNMELHTDRKEGWYEVRLSISDVVPGEHQIAVNETNDTQ
jgi:hypothetical protein